MANEKYFPFRSVSGDRKYSAEDWAKYFALFLSDGVYYSSADKLKAVDNGGMEIKVQKGAGLIGGRMYILDTGKILTLDTADGVLNRIDRIVLRCDYTDRLMTVTVKKGSYSANPTAPELTRSADTYELALADVYVAAGVTAITAANITDQRLNTSLCGIVTGMVEQADTTEIFNQFQAYLEEFKETSQAEFTEWFNSVKDTLSEDAAGELLRMINEVEEALYNINTIGYKAYIEIASTEVTDAKDLMLKATRIAISKGLTNGKNSRFYVMWVEHNHYFMDCTSFGGGAYVAVEMVCGGNGAKYNGTYMASSDTIISYKEFLARTDFTVEGDTIILNWL